MTDKHDEANNKPEELTEIELIQIETGLKYIIDRDDPTAGGMSEIVKLIAELRRLRAENERLKQLELDREEAMEGYLYGKPKAKG